MYGRKTLLENTLHESEDRFRLVTNDMSVLMAYVDADQRYRFNNKLYETWFGLPSASESFFMGSNGVGAWQRSTREIGYGPWLNPGSWRRGP